MGPLNAPARRERHGFLLRAVGRRRCASPAGDGLSGARSASTRQLSVGEPELDDERSYRTARDWCDE